MTATINASNSGSGGLISTGDASGSLALQTAGTTAVTIDTSQNVTIAQAIKLSYSANSNYATDSALSNYSSTNGVYLNGNAAGWLRLSGDGTNASYVQVTGATYASGSNTTQFINAGSERMRIDSSGNLLVGTTSNIAANAKIFAQGNGVGIAVGSGTGSTAYRHMYMNSGDGTLYFFNPTNYAYLSAAGAWTNASDARLKKNIVDIKYGLADVLKVQPRSYQMNSVDGDFVGFIAQELQTVIPEVVTGDPEKQLGVDYGSLVAVAFKAIQELKAINDTQAETINAQSAALAALTARVVALEAK